MPQVAGSWVDCTLNKAHKRVKLKYWRVWNSPFNFCSMCLEAIQKENKTGRYAISNTFHTFKNIDSKPEKDSL